MKVFRSTVLPVTRLLVWLVIAAALCWLAFGRGGDDTPTDALVPTGNAADPTVAVTRGDVVSTIELTGTVAADASTTVKATAAGAVAKLRVATGATVAVGTPLFDVTQTLDPVESPVVTNADGSTSQAAPQTRTRTVTVASTAAGTVAGIAVLAGQDVSVGTDAVVVSPGTLSVSAPLTQDQQFRLLTPPATARAQAPGGPAPFDCGSVRTGPPPASSGSSADGGIQQYDPSGQPVGAPTAQVSCAVPAGTTVFAGMSVDLDLELGRVSGVLTVPSTAVLGSIGNGTVFVLDPATGAPTEKAVTLGLTDGSTIEVTGGLAEGDQVLQYADVGDDTPGGATPAPSGTGG